MSLELTTLCLVTPLDPRKGERYTELVREDLENEKIDNMHNITIRREDYLNHTVYVELSRRSICSYDTNLDKALIRWKTRLHEVSSWHCMKATKYV